MEEGEREKRGYSGVRRKIYRKGVDAEALFCRADKCGVDLDMAKRYHRRYRVCEEHAKGSVVLIGRVAKRFCQQCSSWRNTLPHQDQNIQVVPDPELVPERDMEDIELLESPCRSW
ncbi:squamosa promoter-binding-like protein 5 [Amborella trichopoda]|uniref:squamosa promoter-binding-like protein 5 n=1 Tax=Amborella trichopoda TaxID=13333 RepID=UPI0009C18A03|nr:squamosa promoter-binding-like protein 5 [Amborella trichopoda]|eukprot:XP_020530605.1 squamosa promoter-binding-like protein 5 [Amborella trichopoda]